MKVKQVAKKLLSGQVVLTKTTSPFNGEIYVVEDILGARRVVIGGLTQSGRIIEEIWDKAVKSLHQKPEKVLILGFGAGSAAWVINRRFPHAKIVGVEIDAAILRLARKYFNLSQIRNLKVVNSNASSWVRNSQEKFDLILVDIYQGEKIPEDCQKIGFFKILKVLLTPSGVAIFNHLYSRQGKEQAEKFKKKLEQVFPQIESLRAAANILFKVEALCFKQAFKNVKMKD